MSHHNSGCALLSFLVIVACSAPAERQARLLSQADAAVSAGDLPGAIAKLQTAVSYDPRDLRAVTRLAEVQVQAGSVQEAKSLLDQFPAEVSRDSRFLNLKTRLMLRYGRVNDALPIALALNARGEADPATTQATLEALASKLTTPTELPDLPAGWRLPLVDLLIGGSAPGLAAAWLQTIPGSSDQRERLIDRLLAEVLKSGCREVPDAVIGIAEPGDSANKLLIMRRHFIALENWAGVSRVEEAFLSGYPTQAAWAEVALSAAWGSLRSGHPEAAERLAERVSALNPRSVEPIVVRGLALRDLGREREARKTLELALALDPTNDAARRALAGREREQGAMQIDLNVRGSAPRSP